MCDVHPDGKSALISHGVLNLTHRDGHTPDDVTALEPGKKYHVKVQLDALAVTIPKGHRLRLAVSPSYWPWVWPAKKSSEMCIYTGVSAGDGDNKCYETTLHLPIVETDLKPLEEDFKEPRFGPPLAEEVRHPSRFNRRLERDLVTDKFSLISDMYSGEAYLPHLGVAISDRWIDQTDIMDGDPLSAAAHCERIRVLEWPNVGKDGIRIEVHTKSKLWADEATFFVQNSIVATEGGKEFFNRTQDKSIKREI